MVGRGHSVGGGLGGRPAVCLSERGRGAVARPGHRDGPGADGTVVGRQDAVGGRPGRGPACAPALERGKAGRPGPGAESERCACRRVVGRQDRVGVGLAGRHSACVPAGRRPAGGGSRHPARGRQPDAGGPVVGRRDALGGRLAGAAVRLSPVRRRARAEPGCRRRRGGLGPDGAVVGRRHAAGDELGGQQGTRIPVARAAGVGGRVGEGAGRVPAGPGGQPAGDRGSGPEDRNRGGAGQGPPGKQSAWKSSPGWKPSRRARRESGTWPGWRRRRA